MKPKILLLLASTLVLYACTTKVIYNYFDWVIEWYVDDLVSLTDEQEWQLRGAIESTLEWHRKNQFPFYIKSLEELEEDINSELTVSTLKRFYFGHEKGWMELKYHVAPTLAGLLKTLDANQVDELEENLKEQEEELIEKFVEKTPKEILEERTLRMIDRLESWIDDTNKEQQQLVVNWSHQVKSNAKQWTNTRSDWQSGFVKLIRESRHSDKFNELIIEHFQNSRKFWPEGYEETYYYNVNLTIKLLADISQTLTKEQKNHLLEKINEIKSQLNDLYKNE